MSIVLRNSAVGLGVEWRALEFAGCAVALFLYSGALFPLLLASPDGSVDSVRSVLRALQVPAYAITLALMAPHLDAVLKVLRRNLVLSALLLMPLVSSVWSVSGSVTLRRAVGLLMSVLLAYLLAARFTPRRLLLLLVSVLGFCMVGSLAMLVLSPGLALMPDVPELRGIFTHKNVLGWYAAAATIMNVALLADRSLGRRRLGLALLVASLACLLMSQSGTSLFILLMAGPACAAFLAFAQVAGLKRLLLVVAVAELFAIFLVFAVPASVFVLESVGKDATLTGRIPLWEEVDAMIAQRPVLGWGYEAFWSEANPAAWSIWASVGWNAPHAHNGFRDTLLGLGLVGFVLLVCVILRGLRHGTALLSRPGGSDWLWANVFVSTFVLLNLTESTFLSSNDFFFVVYTTCLLMFSTHAAALRRA